MTRRILLLLIVFVGSFLLFEMEPLTGKIITPRFGGTAAVWTVCLFFYQFIVLCGYALTYGMSKLSARKNLTVYQVIFAVSLLGAFLPGPEKWNPGGGDPVVELLLLFSRYAAVPALMLSSISGTMQVWYRSAGLGNPYPLYSVSNAGSLLALVAYPLLIEPALTIKDTLFGWTAGYASLTVLILGAAFFLRRSDGVSNGESLVVSASGETTSDCATGISTPPESGSATSLSKTFEICKWIALSSLGSLVLSTNTAHLTSDIAPVPLLWVAPLAMYLLTFILVFASPAFYRPFWLTHLWPPLAMMETAMGEQNLLLRTGVSIVDVFLLCMICHGELAASKPSPDRLPLFYLCMSIGGVLGGLIVSVCGPALFDFNAERYATMFIMLGLTLYLIGKHKLYPFGYRPLTFTLVGGSSAALIVLLITEAMPEADLVHRERNFYGCVQIKTLGKELALLNGTILHGVEFTEPSRAMIPLSYYRWPIMVVDYYLRKKSPDRPMNYACVGLGVGTVAAYGRAGDKIDFFEIDPKIVNIAQKYFYYLRGSKAQINVIVGDGRTSMQKLPQEKKYDLIIIDAFNGDAIPLHLLTREAIEIYAQHLAPGGILLFHLSNRYVDLSNPVAGSAVKSGFIPVFIEEERTSRYMALVKDVGAPQAIADLSPKELTLYKVPEKDLTVWTDDFANLVSAFHFR